MTQSAPHPPLSRQTRTLAAAGVNGVATLIEVAGGLLLGSAAVTAEGVHAGAHVCALLIATVGYRFARRQATPAGARRMIHGAGIANGVVLLAAAALLVAESLGRLATPAPIPFAQALGLALFGLLVSGASVAVLHHPHDAMEPRRDLNFEAAFLHMVGDCALGVLAVAGLVAVRWLGWTWADGAAGLVGGVMVAALGLRIVAQAFRPGSAVDVAALNALR